MSNQSHQIEHLKRKVSDLSELPTLPGGVRFVSTMVEDGNSSMQDVGEIITRDQVLSAKILRMVNSPFYGFPGRISSVTHALVLLGFSVVKGLILSQAVFDNLSKQHKGLWEHSLGTAVVSRRIAKAMAIQDCEEIMIAGLLHDLGKVILAVVEPLEYEEVIRQAQEQRLHISEAERMHFGVDHCEVAHWVCDKWHLPTRLIDVLCHHHAPHLAKAEPEPTAIVHVADIFARAMGYGDPGDLVMPPLDRLAFASLGLSLAQYDAILKDAELDYVQGAVIFGIAE